MDDLIKRHDAIESVGFYSCHSGDKLLFADNALKNIPSVDAVEVVRCEDCKHFDGECCDRYADETLGYSHSTQPNFFCAVGERKTDDS